MLEISKLKTFQIRSYHIRS